MLAIASGLGADSTTPGHAGDRDRGGADAGPGGSRRGGGDRLDLDGGDRRLDGVQGPEQGGGGVGAHQARGDQRGDDHASPKRRAAGCAGEQVGVDRNVGARGCGEVRRGGRRHVRASSRPPTTARVRATRVPPCEGVQRRPRSTVSGRVGSSAPAALPKISRGAASGSVRECQQRLGRLDPAAGIGWPVRARAHLAARARGRVIQVHPLKVQRPQRRYTHRHNHGSPVSRAERKRSTLRPSNLIWVMPAQGGAHHGRFHV